MQEALPFGFTPKTSLFAHQRTGIETLCANQYYALWDECGLGKTVQLLYSCLALIKGREIDCAIVCCKKSHGRVWEEQIKAHAPKGVKVHSIIGKSAASRNGGTWPSAHIYLVNYELLSRMNPTRRPTKTDNFPLVGGMYIQGQDARQLYMLLSTRKCAIVLDESQCIKNHQSKVTKVLCGLAPMARRRYIATGTPVAEKPDDLWAQVHFLDQGRLLGKNYYAFISKYATFHETTDGRRWITNFRNLGELRKLTQRVSIRRTKEECLDLPEKIYEKSYLFPTSHQAKVLNTAREGLVSYLRGVSGGRVRVTDANFAARFQSILAASAFPEAIDGNFRHDGDSAKFTELLELLEENEKEQFLVWTVHTRAAEIAQDRLVRAGVPAVFVHGKMPTSQRTDNITRFKVRGARVLCATMASMREAETLTNARHAYYLQLDFSLLNWKQSQDRIHRIGTTGTVVIHLPIMRHSMDEYLVTKLSQKEADAYRSTDSDTLSSGVLNAQDLINALK